VVFLNTFCGFARSADKLIRQLAVITFCLDSNYGTFLALIHKGQNLPSFYLSAFGANASPFSEDVHNNSQKEICTSQQAGGLMY